MPLESYRMKITKSQLKKIIFEEVVDRLIEIEAQKFRIALREEFAKEGILLTEAQEDKEIEDWKKQKSMSQAEIELDRKSDSILNSK